LESGTIAFGGTVKQTTSMTSTTTFTKGATLQAKTFSLDAGTLTGQGTINGNLDQTGGTLAPGTNEPKKQLGTLRIKGNYGQNAKGTFSININDNGNIGALDVTGTTGVNGPLTVTQSASWKPKATAADVTFITSGKPITGQLMPVTVPTWNSDVANLTYVAKIKAMTTYVLSVKTRANTGVQGTSTAVAANSTIPTFGQAVTFTATVSTSSGTPTGQVNFVDGGAVLGNGTLNGSDVATLTTGGLSTGSNNITAVYSGDVSYASSTSSALVETISAARNPVVTGISPSSGSTAGGTQVILFGITFTGTTGIMFGNVAANTWIVNADNQITVLSPPQPANTVDIIVTSYAGTSATGLFDQFTYNSASAPSVSSLLTSTCGLYLFFATFRTIISAGIQLPTRTTAPARTFPASACQNRCWPPSGSITPSRGVILRRPPVLASGAPLLLAVARIWEPSPQQDLALPRNP